MRIFLVNITIIFTCVFTQAQKFYQYEIIPDHNAIVVVEDAAKDNNGFIWMATDSGLLRYDGNDLRIFRKNIPSQHGYKILPSGSGFYYAHNAGISYIIPGNEDIEAGLIVGASIDPSDDEIHYPSDMVITGKDSLWISQEKGFISLHNRGKLQHFQPASQNSNYQLLSHKGRIYALASDGALYQYGERSNQFQKIGNYPGSRDLVSYQDGLILSGNQIIRLTMDSSGKILNKKQFVPSIKGNISTISLYNQDQLLVAIKGSGLYIIENIYSVDYELKKIYSNNDPHRVDDLPFININNIVIDETDHYIFLCLDNGLGVLKKRFFESVDDLPNGSITSITGDGEFLYVDMGEVYKVSPTKNGYLARNINLPISESIGSLEHHNGTLYLGSGEGIIYAYRDELSILIDLTDRGEGVFIIHGDTRNRLWICQAPDVNPIIGIACILPGGQLKEYGREEGLMDRILVVKESKRGRIYVAGIGEESYLHRYIEEEDRFENMSLPFDFDIGDNFEVHDIAIADDGTIYLASTAGLLRHDLDRIVKVDLGENFQTLEARSVHAADNGIWVSTETQGMVFMDGENIIPISEESGLPSKVMSYRCIYNDDKDRLWIGTAEGAVYTLTQGPELFRTRTPYLSTSNCSLRDSFLVGVEGQDLNFKMNTVSSSRDKIWYQYSINDNPWSESIENNEIDIKGLESGNHLMKVRSKIKGGYKWSEPYIKTLKIKRLWYKNPLIIIPIVFVGLGSMIFIWIGSKTESSESKRDEEESPDYEYKVHQVDSEHLNVLGSIISRLSPGTKWDYILEELSTSLFRVEKVDAYVICWIEKNGIAIYEGADKKARIYGKLDDVSSIKLASNCLEHGKVSLTSDLNEGRSEGCDFAKGYTSMAGMPFKMGPKNKGAVFLMSEDQLDDTHLAFLKPLTAYLEQIL